MTEKANGSSPEGLPVTATFKECPKCQTKFQPARRNQRYCSRKCQKNGARGSRQSENSQLSSTHFNRARDLALMVYSRPPFERLGIMKDILDCVPHDAGLRRILRDPTLLRANPFKDRGLFLPGRSKTISQAANTYTQMFFGVSVAVYVQQVLDGTVNQEFPVKCGT